MATRNKSFLTNPFMAVALGCVMALAVACGDDDDSGTETPSGGSKAQGGTSSAGKNTGGTSSAGKSATAGDGPIVTGGGGSGPDVVEGGAGAGGAPVDCTDDADKGCYSCKPKTHAQFLNHCPTTGCQSFDNEDLTSLKDGVLPDLP